MSQSTHRPPLQRRLHLIPLTSHSPAVLPLSSCSTHALTARPLSECLLLIESRIVASATLGIDVLPQVPLVWAINANLTVYSDPIQTQQFLGKPSFLAF